MKWSTAAVLSGVGSVVLLSTWLANDGDRNRGAPFPTTVKALSSPSPSASPTRLTADPWRAAEGLPRSEPARLRIPVIRVDAAVHGVDRNRDGYPKTPPGTEKEKKKLVGWYEDGPSPGERGNALLGGMNGGDQSGAVFRLLDEVRQGDQVLIERDDGATAVFTVDAVDVYSKGDLPDSKVYVSTSRPELRLIASGGPDDKDNGKKNEKDKKDKKGNDKGDKGDDKEKKRKDIVVVSAHLTTVR